MSSRLWIACLSALALSSGAFYFTRGMDRPEPQSANLVTIREEPLSDETRKARALVDAGLGSMARNEPKGAEAAFRRALEVDPGYTRARAALANLYLAMGHRARGEGELWAATQSDPESEELLHIVDSYGLSAKAQDEHTAFYESILRIKPDSLVAKKRVTEILILQGDYKKASGLVGHIWQTQPGDSDAIYLDGRIALERKEYARAIEKLLGITRRDATFAPAYYFLGLARLGSGDFRQARAEFIKAKELHPVWLAPRTALARNYIASGDYDLAMEEIGPVLQTQPDSFDALMVAGVARLKRGQVARALEFFQSARELAPDKADPYVHIGSAYLEQENYPRAIAAYEEALKRDPDEIEALGSVARILALKGEGKQAFERVERHLAKTKNKGEVYELLGRLSLDHGNYEKALSYLKKAVEQKPELVSAGLLIADIHVARNELDQAVVHAERIVQQHPGAVEPYLLLGKIYDQRGQPQQANRYYRKALDLNPQSAVAANNLAWNYTQHGGRLDIALTFAQKARQLNPNDPRIAHTLGWIFYKTGAYRTAVKLLKESSDRLKHRDPTILYHLALAYRKSDEPALAKEALSKALRLKRDFPGLVEAQQTLAEIEAAALAQRGRSE